MEQSKFPELETDEKKGLLETISYLLSYEIASSWVAKNIRVPVIQSMVANYYHKKVIRKLRAFVEFTSFQESMKDKQDKKTANNLDVS